MSQTRDRVAVLLSGGLDSTVLCVDLLRDYAQVFPLYVRCGLRWEEVELAATRDFLKRVRMEGIQPLVVLEEPMREVYGAHWSTDGEEVPSSGTPDEAVYLPGRNILLTVKTAVWCRLRNIETLALGCLASNPFPDSTPDLFHGLESVLNQAMGGGPRLIRPFDRLQKKEVVLRGHNLPLDFTFSCIHPIGRLHCGKCNKCAERQKGFHEAGVLDRTHYAAWDSSETCTKRSVSMHADRPELTG
jgi:7-cyano-7-deazaguanine synthase